MCMSKAPAPIQPVTPAAKPAPAPTNVPEAPQLIEEAELDMDPTMKTKRGRNSLKIDKSVNANSSGSGVNVT